MSSLRNLTILQKVTLFHSFVAVKFNYISRVLPCAKTIAIGTQRQGRKFIWQGNIERMHQDRTPLPYIEGRYFRCPQSTQSTDAGRWSEHHRSRRKLESFLKEATSMEKAN